MHNDEKGIMYSVHTSCAVVTIRALEDAGFASRQELFNQHIGNAKRFGLMPNDFDTLRKALFDLGFVMQSSRLER